MHGPFDLLKAAVAQKASDRTVENLFLETLVAYRNDPKVLSRACKLLDKRRKRLARKLVVRAMTNWAETQVVTA